MFGLCVFIYFNFFGCFFVTVFLLSFYLFIYIFIYLLFVQIMDRCNTHKYVSVP